MNRCWLILGFACAAVAARAEDSAPAQSSGGDGSFKSTVKRSGHDIGDAGKKVGREFAKAGKQVGHGTAKTVQSIGHKISSDVKSNNFKPKAQGETPKGDQGRGDDQK